MSMFANSPNCLPQLPLPLELAALVPKITVVCKHAASLSAIDLPMMDSKSLENVARLMDKSRSLCEGLPLPFVLGKDTPSPSYFKFVGEASATFLAFSGKYIQQVTIHIESKLIQLMGKVAAIPLHTEV